MKTSLILCLATLIGAPLAFADKSVDFPKAAPLLSVSLPDAWEVDIDDDGLMATPSKDDDSVIVEFVELEAALADHDAAVKEAKETMAEFKKMKYDDMEKGEKDGLGITIINATGEDEHGKAFINLVLLAKPGTKNFILMSCISSKEGSDKHGAAIGALIQSLKAK
ncbi:hypothetical protein [Prosthecobacter sp.]|uniref:hypothetical protein n=1 Tax=Prosthecobacter sp. TaxID=1965333 RepID=UPI002ABB6A6D|nr:hypothetical protein [Prosthecobacter sp.]MDZ4401354.1 hypothetical protein [Prosthecobacter sp.]